MGLIDQLESLCDVSDILQRCRNIISFCQDALCYGPIEVSPQRFIHVGGGQDNSNEGLAVILGVLGDAVYEIEQFLDQGMKEGWLREFKEAEGGQADGAD